LGHLLRALAHLLECLSLLVARFLKLVLLQRVLGFAHRILRVAELIGIARAHLLQLFFQLIELFAKLRLPILEAALAALLTADVVAFGTLPAFALFAAALLIGVHAVLASLRASASLTLAGLRRALAIGIVLRAAFRLRAFLAAPLAKRIVHQ